MAFVHPFDDADVIAGQGTLGARAARGRRPICAKVLVPVGGGALGAPASRSLIKSACVPTSRVVGRPGRRSDADDRRRHRRQPARRDHPAADRPWLRRRRRVDEDAVAEAIVAPARAVPSSSSRAPAPSASPRCVGGLTEPPRDGTTAVVLSRRQRRRRACSPRSRAITRRSPAAASSSRRDCRTVPARSAQPARGCRPHRAPTSLEVSHVREGIELHVRETGVQLVLETRGPRPCRRSVGAAARRSRRGYSG